MLVAVVGFIVLASYNAVVALRQRIDKAWANIDVVLKQRHDQLPNLVAAVRGLMAFERDVLTEVTRGPGRLLADRADPRPGRDVGGDERRRPLAVRGRRALPGPQVRGQRRRTCRTRSSGSRAMIADRRELYNDQVYRYNTRIAPGSRRPAGAAVLGWRPARVLRGGRRPTPTVRTPTSASA